MTTFQVAEPRPAIGSTSRSGSGSRTASPRRPSRISWSSWRPSPQGASCRSWAVKRTEPAAEHPGVAQGADRLDGGGDPPFHVGGTAAGEPAVLDSRRHERQVDRVEVAVELERPPRPAALEPDDDGRRRRDSPPSGRSTAKPSAVEDLRQAVADRPGLAGRARHFDQPPRGLDQPLAVRRAISSARGLLDRRS